MPDLSVHNWQDVASVVTAISFPLPIFSAFVAYRQFKAQARISAGEITGDILIRFNENFQSTSALRRSLQAKFTKGDKTITRQEVLQYYYQYWQQREVEWEYFIKGLLSEDLLSRWSENCLKHIIGRRNLYYYENNEKFEMKSRDVFENEVLNSILLRADTCRSFYVDLFELAKKFEVLNWPLEDARSYREIKKLVGRYHRKLSIPTY